MRIPDFEIVPERRNEIADAFHTACRRARPAAGGEATGADPVPRATRPAHVAGTDSAEETPVFACDDITTGATIPGPAIVEEPTTTIVVFPGWELKLAAPDLYRMARVR